MQYDIDTSKVYILQNDKQCWDLGSIEKDGTSSVKKSNITAWLLCK